MVELEWGSWQWNEDHFPADQLDADGDTWGIRWRGMEKMRHDSYLRLIEGRLRGPSPLNVLDIGCALCDFTEKVWNLNRDNRISGMDMSANAINWNSKKFPVFEFKQDAIPEIPFDKKFDVIFCLEVLCYLDPQGRQEAIDRIHASLAPQGTLMFAGILNGGDRHHTEEEMVDMIGRNFNIETVFYNYWTLYRDLIEGPFNKVHAYAAEAERLLSMGEQEWRAWREQNGGMRARMVGILRLLNPLSRWLAARVACAAKAILSSTMLARLMRCISRKARPQQADEIVIVAVSR